MTRNKYYCTRPRLVSKLMNAGFIYIRIERNCFNPSYHVWVFDRNPQIMAVVDAFYAEIKKGGEQ